MLIKYVLIIAAGVTLHVPILLGIFFFWPGRTKRDTKFCRERFIINIMILPFSQVDKWNYNKDIVQALTDINSNLQSI
jgi:hypothetical protein